MIDGDRLMRSVTPLELPPEKPADDARIEEIITRMQHDSIPSFLRA